MNKEIILKWLNMSREEEMKQMSELINGKESHSDSILAISIALRYRINKQDHDNNRRLP